MTNQKFPTWLITILIFAVVAALVVSLKELITLVAIAYALGYLADKPITILEKHRIPRALGFVIVCLILISLISLMCVIILPPLLTQGIELVQRLPEIANKYSLRAQRIIEGLSPGATQKYFSQKALLSYLDPALVQNFFDKFLLALLTGYNFAMAALNIVLLPIVTFYFAVDFKRIHRSMLRLLDTDTRATVMRVSHKINVVISSYLQGQVIVALLLAVLYCLGFAIVGVPLWLAIGVLAGVLNIVPYLGTITGIVLSFGLLLVDGAQSSAYWGLVGVFAIAQFLEGNIITPKVVGEKVGLSPLVVLIAVLAFGQLFGLLGVIIAVPATAALKVIFQEILDKRNEQEESHA